MSATDFGVNVAGGGIGEDPTGFFSQYFNWFGQNTWGWVIIAIMIALIILIIAFFFGWIGAASKKEGAINAMGTRRKGNTSPIGMQTRETLSNNALTFGYESDPNAFCKNAGEPTNDPWDYMRAESAKAPVTPGDEYLTRYTDPETAFDSIAFQAAVGR